MIFWLISYQMQAVFYRQDGTHSANEPLDQIVLTPKSPAEWLFDWNSEKGPFPRPGEHTSDVRRIVRIYSATPVSIRPEGLTPEVIEFFQIDVADLQTEVMG